MPEQETIERAQEDAREGKSPSTQAGEFVREEIHHVREGKHSAASHAALSRQTKSVARKRGSSARQSSAKKAAQTRRRNA